MSTSFEFLYNFYTIFFNQILRKNLSCDLQKGKHRPKPDLGQKPMSRRANRFRDSLLNKSPQREILKSRDLESLLVANSNRELRMIIENLTYDEEKNFL